MRPQLTDNELAIIGRLVGEVAPEQLRYVECFVAEPVSLFVPAVGPCGYAQSRDHSHPGYSFILAFDRNTEVTAEGRTFRSEPGKLMAMMPGAVHHELAGDEPPRYIAIFIEPGAFATELARYPACDLASLNFCPFAPETELPALLRGFMNECEAGLPGREAVLTAMGVRIIHSLIRAALDVRGKPSAAGTRLEILRAVQYLHDHFAERLTVADLAKIAGMSTSHFSRLFRHETGQTPMDYLLRLRIQRSRLLLRAGGDSVTSVALKCGFATPSHFADCFRKHCGISPSEYLKQRD